MSDGGKGDKRRPASVSQEELKERWEAIFGKNTPQKNLNRSCKNRYCFCTGECQEGNKTDENSTKRSSTDTRCLLDTTK